MTDTLDEMYDKNDICVSVYITLRPTNCRQGQFYLLSTINKEGMLKRPFVSAIGIPKEEISEFIDLHLRPHVEDLTSYLKDNSGSDTNTFLCPSRPNFFFSYDGCHFLIHEYSSQ